MRNYRVAFYITDNDGNPITSGNSPIALRDSDQTQNWVTGTHIANGVWVFEIPAGWASGVEIGVNTSGSTYTRDENLSGGDNSAGYMLTPVMEIS